MPCNSHRYSLPSPSCVPTMLQPPLQPALPEPCAYRAAASLILCLALSDHKAGIVRHQWVRVGSKSLGMRFTRKARRNDR